MVIKACSTSFRSACSIRSQMSWADETDAAPRRPVMILRLCFTWVRADVQAQVHAEVGLGWLSPWVPEAAPITYLLSRAPTATWAEREA